MKLYKEEDLLKIRKSINLYRLIYILSIVFIFVCVALGLIFSSYYHKLLAMIICSIVNIVSFIISVFFASKCSYYKHLHFEMINLLESTSTKEKDLILSISEKPITLADGSMCYEIVVKNETGQKYLYLSEIFDRNLLKINHTYLLSISFDYIVEIDYEN